MRAIVETGAGCGPDASSPAALKPLTVRIPAAVRLTGIGRSKLYLLIKAGEVEVVKVGASTLITYASLERLIERGREAGPAVRRGRSAP